MWHFILQLKWQDPDVDGLVEFLAKEKGFAEDRVKNGAKKLQKGRSGSVQQRMDSFFTVVSTTNSASKRKVFVTFLDFFVPTLACPLNFDVYWWIYSGRLPYARLRSC
jgi:hypothetical protein